MKKIEEIMKLVDAYGDACETFGDYQVHANAMECVSAKAAIETALRELVERKDLHAEIMNISADKACIDELGINERLAYKRGHKDARHAAAEIVAAIGA